MRSPGIVTPRTRHRPARLDDYVTYGDSDVISMEESSSEDEEPSSPSDFHRQIFPGGEAVEKDFDVDRIMARATEQGLDSYLVHWKPTIVEAHQVKTRDDGERTVDIDGVQYREVEDILSLDEHADGTQRMTVVWRESWRPVWRLGRALGCIADYYRRHPEEDYKRPLQPRFWKSYQLDPQKLHLQIEAMAWAEVELNGRDFSPEHVDYTKPVMKLCTRLLRRKQESWVRLLNLPVARQLKFTDQWIAKGHFRIQRMANLRAMLVHCVGELKEKWCTSCAKNDVPFHGCVVDDGEYRGCCTNCIVLGGGGETYCEWHLAIRHCERPRASVPVQIAEASGGDEEVDEDETMTDQTEMPPAADSQGMDVTPRALRSAMLKSGNSSEKRTPSEIRSSQVDEDHMNEDHPAPSDDHTIGNFDMDYEVPDSRESTPISSEDDLYRLTPGLRARFRDTQESGIKSGPSTEPIPSSKELSCGRGLFASLPRDSIETDRPPRSESILAFRPRESTSVPAEGIRAAEHWNALNGDSATPHRGGNAVGKSQNIHTPQPKCQRPSLAPVTPRVGKHRECEQSFTCLDPEIGFPEARNGPTLLYSDHKFKQSGEATSAEVRFILSRCSCGNAERLRSIFRDSIAVRRERGLDYEGLSFEQEMASTFWPELNKTIAIVCPPRRGAGFVDGEEIVID